MEDFKFLQNGCIPFDDYIPTIKLKLKKLIYLPLVVKLFVKCFRCQIIIVKTKLMSALLMGILYIIEQKVVVVINDDNLKTIKYKTLK